MRSIQQDLAYGWRGFRKQPGFAILSILTLALGIGSATVIFSVIQNVLLNPFPYKGADRVVAIQIRDQKNPRNWRSYFSVPEFLEFQKQCKSYEDVIGGTSEDILYDNGSGTEQFTGGLVTKNMFEVLGVPAMLGRGIQSEDAKPGAPPVFVMSHKLWMRRFNLDPSILGKTFTLNGAATTLVGIMPPRFTKVGADMWRPVDLETIEPSKLGPGETSFLFQGRRKPGVSLAAAQAEAEVVVRNVAKLFPKAYPEAFNVRVVSWVDNLVDQFKTTLYTMAAAVGLLLLIACGNVANMLLVRGFAREKEFAVRSALGAGRGRIVRQLLLESLLLAVGGAVAGCLFAFFGLKALVRLIPDGLIPREAVIELNIPVLLFSLGIAIVTALLFGLLPAWQTARQEIVEPLRDAGKGMHGGFRRGHARNVLVVAEVSLSLVLLAAAGLTMRSFIAMQNQDLGFQPEKIFHARVPFPRGQTVDAAFLQHFYETLTTRIQALPGVIAASPVIGLPPFGGLGSEADVAGKTHSDAWRASVQLIGEGFFQTMSGKLAQGRLLTEADIRGARKVAVVNQSLVEKFFGKDNPIGQRVRAKVFEDLPREPLRDAWFEIVGVVKDMKNRGVQDPPWPELFVPYTVTAVFNRGLLVRTATDPTYFESTLLKEIWAVDSRVSLTMTGPISQFLDNFVYAEPRFSLVIFGVFAGVGLLLVTIGVYSTIAYTVTRQTQEIGIRMALGALPGDVLSMVLRMGIRLVGLGLVFGIALTLVVSRVLASQLSNVSTRDPMTLAIVSAVVAAAGLVACLVPAFRATKVDPMTALRQN